MKYPLLEARADIDIMNLHSKFGENKIKNI